MADPLGVVSASFKVMERSQHVSIQMEEIPAAAGRLLTLEHLKPVWDQEFHLTGEPKKVLAYVFVLDALNFFFWAIRGQKRWEITHNGKTYDGYFALALAVRRAFESGMPLWDPRFLKEISPEAFFAIFEGNGSISYIHWRYNNIVELGSVTTERFGGSFENIVKLCNGSAVRLVSLMAQNFESFRDVARYRGLEVPFYKRAQLLAWDMYLAFGGKGYGSFYDIDQLTAFADYKLPQVLRELGVLSYGKELSDLVDSGVTIPQGSPMEIEIRAGTIVAVELLKKEMGRHKAHVSSPEIDFLLWNLGQRDEFRKRPYHKTPTIFY